MKKYLMLCATVLTHICASDKSEWHVEQREKWTIDGVTNNGEIIIGVFKPIQATCTFYTKNDIPKITVNFDEFVKAIMVSDSREDKWLLSNHGTLGLHDAMWSFLAELKQDITHSSLGAALIMREPSMGKVGRTLDTLFKDALAQKPADFIGTGYKGYAYFLAAPQENPNFLNNTSVKGYKDDCSHLTGQVIQAVTLDVVETLYKHQYEDYSYRTDYFAQQHVASRVTALLTMVERTR